MKFRQLSCLLDQSGYETPINCLWVNLQMDKIVVLGTYYSYDLLLAEKYNL